MNKNEAIPLYREGRHYDLLNAEVVADIPFYVEEAKRAADSSPPYRKERGKVGHHAISHPPAKSIRRMGQPGAVLELACGTGRLTIPIAQNGVEIVGLDQSASMLAHLRTKAKQAGTEIPLVEGDCREFALGRKFALIFMAFNSVQHLHDYASLAALFRNVRNHLMPGGKFVFDVFNPSVAILARDGTKRTREREYEDPDGRGTVTLEQTMVYDDASQVNRIKWYFSRAGEKDFRVEDLHMRCFFPEELNLLVRSQGFEIVEKFGNFERKMFGSGDPKQVVVCKAWTEL